jgi:hypothetical protein
MGTLKSEFISRFAARLQIEPEVLSHTPRSGWWYTCVRRARDIFRKKQFGALVEYIKALAHNSSTFLGKMTVIFIEPAFSCMHMYNFIIFDREKYTGLGRKSARAYLVRFSFLQRAVTAHTERKSEKKMQHFFQM